MTDELARRLTEAKRREEETGWSDLHAARTAAREVLAAGTSVRIVSPNAEESDLLGVIEFWRCASVRLGAPNDEALHGHPLNAKGLQFYAPHEVHNSQWLEEHIGINSVHSKHSDGPWRELHRYFLAFHDEMFEALAASIETRLVHGTLTPLLNELTQELIDRPRRMVNLTA